MKLNNELNFEDLGDYGFCLRATGDWVYYLGTIENPLMATIRVLPDRKVVLRFRNPGTIELPKILSELIKDEVFV